MKLAARISRFTFVLGACFLAPFSYATEALLVYQGKNLWVAEADNVPLRQVLNAAKKGRGAFTIILPSADKPLSLQRLGILTQLLEKQRGGKTVVLTEGAGNTPMNSLNLRW